MMRRNQKNIIETKRIGVLSIYRLRVLEIRVVISLFGPRMDEVTGGWKATNARKTLLTKLS
jgi:hypothetical protein